MAVREIRNSHKWESKLRPGLKLNQTQRHKLVLYLFLLKHWVMCSMLFKMAVVELCPLTKMKASLSQIMKIPNDF